MTNTPQSRLKFLLLYTILKSFQRFFSLIYILYCFFILCTFFRHIYSVLYKRPPRGGQGLCFKWLLEITKLFHTHTGRRNPSGPPKFYTPLKCNDPFCVGRAGCFYIFPDISRSYCTIVFPVLSIVFSFLSKV